MSCGPGSQHLGPLPGVGRLSLSKLKSVSGAKSNTEQSVENTLAADLERTSSQMQQRKDFTPTSSSYNCALSTQAENLVSVSFRDSSSAPHAYSKNKSGGSSMLKLNLLKRSKDKDVVDRQEDMKIKDEVVEQDGGVECDHEEFFDAESEDEVEGKMLQSRLLSTQSPGATPGAPVLF